MVSVEAIARYEQNRKQIIIPSVKVKEKKSIKNTVLSGNLHSNWAILYEDNE